ncbi:hypothetical protein GGTG_07698 [Gaeumannomyces tritici R3-111a-1]|uniref:Uncharacterized protein n=1 Tax=Gaeumannomyces tritici (strain R3-111a-1) TaxID=644352 RepID=J3P2F1_GAET3|nr:hypothetical protein GGTG_07698 [Gaeumannomyces tritici R3-111a-1]EJT73843.1 hypothetical protein GGTG_07698 [Gaeumannomyces tritici R3-111a-1]
MFELPSKLNTGSKVQYSNQSEEIVSGGSLYPGFGPAPQGHPAHSWCPDQHPADVADKAAAAEGGFDSGLRRAAYPDRQGMRFLLIPLAAAPATAPARLGLRDGGGFFRAMLLVIVHYAHVSEDFIPAFAHLVAFDLTTDPFAANASSEAAPNLATTSLGCKERKMLQNCIVDISNLQLLTGLAILITGFISLPCGSENDPPPISAYIGKWW